MSISSEITRISKNVSDSLDAVALKGVTVPSGSNSDDLPGLIAQITVGGTGSIVITDTTDSAGGVVRTITAVDISDTTAVASDVASGKYFYTADGTKTSGTASGGSPTLQTKTATPTESQQTIEPDSGYDGLSSVTVSAISASYVGSGIIRRDSTDLSASGMTVTVPSGYYSSNATKTLSDANLVAGNIKKDVTIFGVTGTLEGGSLVITDVSNTSGTTAEISVSGSGGSAQTETGTFVGNDANVITISCDFAPDLIYIRGDLTSSASLRGICSVNIIKDTVIYVTADSSTSASDEYLLFAAHGITGYNTDTTYPYATYSNGVLSVDTVMNSGTARWNSSVTYSYKLIGWS